MDTILAKATADLAKINKTISEQKDEIECLSDALKEAQDYVSSLEEQRASLEAFLHHYENYAAVGMHLPTHGFRNPEKKKREHGLQHPPFAAGTNAAQIEQTVVAILKDVGVPMKIGPLTDEIHNRGVKVAGQRPRTVVASVLSRSNKVYYDHPDGWRLIQPWDELDDEGNQSFPFDVL